MRLVAIEWEDARDLATDQWYDVQEWEYIPCIVRTVGYVLKETKKGYILTNSMHETQTGPVNQIPRAMVRSIREYSN